MNFVLPGAARQNKIHIHLPSSSAPARTCDRYADWDIGFVDAAVLAVVERLNEGELATLDRRHFGLLRLRHADTLTLLP